MPQPSRVFISAAGLSLAAATALAGTAGAATAATPHVLRVGTFHGIKGTFTTIQAAVDAAKPGDWVLVGPGDYKERGDYTTHKPDPGEAKAGVWIGVTGLHLRGMNRNTVVVDGTKAGSPQCSNATADQLAGPPGSAGRNGVEAFKTSNVSIENLTACNFLRRDEGGNEIWWNAGDGSGQQSPMPYHGAYLSATSTYYSSTLSGSYGIFVSNSSGPGVITHTYASNMNDSSYYVGACADCNAVLDDAHAEHSALGFSGTNQGGHSIIQNSEWDDNASGIVTNSQNNDDAPSPQLGLCPGSGTVSCTIWKNNYVHDNNDPNVPQAGSAAQGPIGTGMVIAGGRHDTLINNRVENNGSWGILTVPYPDTETPPTGIGQDCNYGIKAAPGGPACLYSDWGSEIANNVFKGNGFFGNPTNGDLADLSSPPAPQEIKPPETPPAPANCWHGNVQETGGPATSSPVALQTAQGTCGNPAAFPSNYAPAEQAVLLAQAACATGTTPCAPGMNYPQTTTVTILPLKPQTTMPNPCAGVPPNPWCVNGVPAKAAVAATSGSTTTSGAGSGVGATSGTTSGSTSSASPTLAFTGSSALLPAAGVLVALTGAFYLRRRRRIGG